MSLPQTTREYVLSKIGSYKDLRIRESKVPKLRAGEVLVKVHAVSIQYRDLSIATGTYPAEIAGNLVPCSDMAGEVIAVGEDVDQWKTGDRVCSNFSTGHLHGDPDEATAATSLGGQAPGVLTEYRTFPVQTLVRIPDHLSFAQASTLPCAAVTAYNALYGPRPVKAGDYVLVLGTGGVSIFALQLAVAAGATVIATSSSDEKLEVAAKLGAKFLINYRKTPDWAREVKKITNGVGVDHVIEVGGGTLPKSLNSLRMGGYIHLIGVVSKDSAEPNLVLPIITGAANIRGIYIGSVAQFKDMNRLLEAHPEKTTPVIDKVFPFENAVDAYAHLESQTHVGKVVIEVAKE